MTKKGNVRILGIDPGSRLCGYAFITSKSPYTISRHCIKLDDVGVIKANLNLPFGERIGLLHSTLFGLVKELAPDIVIMEDAFFGANARSALKLGMARGALMAAVARTGLSVIEVSPTHVKKTIAGTGAADKEMISISLNSLIGFQRGNLPHDASDALAIALCGVLLHQTPTIAAKKTNATSNTPLTHLLSEQQESVDKNPARGNV
ncbi:MAG: crossover junction endodeoxyribonuclease RuvC [Bdellovibrionota bacterium]